MENPKKVERSTFFFYCHYKRIFTYLIHFNETYLGLEHIGVIIAPPLVVKDLLRPYLVFPDPGMKLKDLLLLPRIRKSVRHSVFT